jgi:hypothetical protein
MNNPNDALKIWLDSFPYQKVKGEMEEVQTQLNKWGQRLVELQEAIRLYERFRSPVAAANGSHSVTAAVLAKPTLRAAVKLVLTESPDREWSNAQLSELLISKGWLRDDAQGRANLYSMLSVMAKNGQIRRIRSGWYRAPSGSEALLLEDRA